VAEWPLRISVNNVNAVLYTNTHTQTDTTQLLASPRLLTDSNHTSTSTTSTVTTATPTMTMMKTWVELHDAYLL